VRLESGSCVVRSWRWRDLPTLARQANSIAVSQNMLRFPYPYTRRDAALFLGFLQLRGILGRPETHFAIEAEADLAGGIGLLIGSGAQRRTAELFYWLGESLWGRGIATAAVRTLTEYGFRALRLTRVFALPFSDNQASCRVLEKAGFRQEAFQPRSATKDGIVHDQWMYARTHEPP